MTVRFLKHIALEIPAADMDKAISFYRDFGLEEKSRGTVCSLGCKGRRYDSIYLIPTEGKKKLHHVAMGTTDAGLVSILKKVVSVGIALHEPPVGFSNEGIWFRNEQGVLFHIEACEEEEEVLPEQPFLINSPGHYSRINAGALPPKSQLADVVPRKLGHALLFTPDVDSSIAFLTDILGMRLSDRSQDVVAFLHCQGGSDHHVLALAKSSGIGFHHMSFMVGTPDEVGLGGCRMIEKGYTKGWGFGRHAIGSNFFHYVGDPWGSYLEYYSDMDYITDSEAWSANNWPLEDSLHTWGPNPPEDFVHNYEQD